MSMNKDNFHSWVRVSHGLNKLVTNLNNNEQETSEVQGRICVKIECRCFCKPIKGRSKTTDEILSAPPQEPYLLVNEFGPMFNQEIIQSPIVKC